MIATRGIAVLVVGLLAAGCSGKPITRGEIADREAARETATCAENYFRLGNKEPRNEIWAMCLEATSSLARRDIEKVRQRVILDQRYDVFATETRP